MSSRSLTWLHISDIHLGDQTQAHWRNEALGSLITTIEKERLSGWQPDLVFFTGDLGFSGKHHEYFPSEPSNYSAEFFFDQVLDKAGLGHKNKERLFIVPGNHDVDRDLARKIVLPNGQNHDDWIMNLINSDETSYQDACDKFFGEQNYLTILLQKFQDFQSFYYSYFGSDFFKNKPYLINIVKLPEFTIGIMGFNTAWLAGDKDNTYDQILGQLPLELAAAELAKSEVDIKFAVFHHPCDELHENERHTIKHRLALYSDFVLCGHLDNPDLPNPQVTKLKQVPFIQVGPTYKGPRFPNRFYFARYWIENGAEKITFNPFCYSYKTFTWIPDTEGVTLVEQRYGSNVINLGPIAEPRMLPESSIVESPLGFRGRQEQLSKLDKWYESRVPLIAAIGLSGIGKTYLMRKWLAQKADSSLGFAYQVIDASTPFVSEDDDPAKFAAQVLERISHLCGVVPTLVREMPAEELASKVRSFKEILVIDHAEFLCYKRGSKHHVGRLVAKFEQFLSAFVKIPFGPGRIILISNLRPTGLIEKELIDGRYIEVIGSQHDPWQIEGLDEEDSISFMSDLLGTDHGFSLEYLKKIAKRFGGHPMALRWFSMISRENQERMLIEEFTGVLPFSELHSLLGNVVRNCSVNEVNLLKIACVLRQAEQPDFFNIIQPTVGLPNIYEYLQLLRSRCLVEYASIPRIGFNAHSIVKEWARQTYATELVELHRSMASAYSNKNDALPAAYHFAQAGDYQNAKEWRNKYTWRNLKEGRQAYFDGDFTLAREHSTEFIEETCQLPQTAATPRYLSNAYLNRAVNQHRESFNWNAECADLRKALEQWPDNERVLNFYIAVLGEALRQYHPWREIDTELGYVVPFAEKAAQRSGPNSPAMIALLRLLCFWGQHTSDSKCKGIVYEKMGRVVSPNLDIAKRKIMDEESFKAYVQALTFLARKQDADDRMRYIAAAVDLADKAAIAGHSAELLLIQATAYYVRASFTLNASERRQWLIKTEDVLVSIRDSVALPAGFARLFSIAMLDSANLKNGDEAINEVQKAIDELGYLRKRTLSTPYRDSEFDSAEIRLHLRAAEIAPKIRQKHLLHALNIVRKLLCSGVKLTPELAECSIEAFIEGTQESISAGMLPEDEILESVPLPEAMRVSRNEMVQLDKMIEAAERAMPSFRFAMLRLRLRIQYLSTNWRIGDPGEPKMAQEAIDQAKMLLIEHADEPLVWLESSELWKIIAQRTFSNTRFDEAVREAKVAFAHLPDHTSHTKYVLKEAAFLRGIMDYDGARRIISLYLTKEKLAHARFALCNLTLDVVTHSICSNVAEDIQLRKDAISASELYREYLSYLGIAHEDEADRKAARRIICWLRCASYAGIADVGDLTWIDDIYRQVDFGKNEIKNIQILTQLSNSPNLLARILGKHMLDGTMWREVGTYLSTQSGLDPNRQEQAMNFWRISEWWLNHSLKWEGKRRGKVSINLTNLNLARAFLLHPVGSETWHQGVKILRELHSNQMPWVYQRFVIQLWDQIVKSA